MAKLWVQVQAGMWVRNGPEVGQVHRLYQGPFWNEGSHDLDLLLLQIWMAHSDPDESANLLLLPCYMLHHCPPSIVVFIKQVIVLTIRDEILWKPSS